MRKELEKILKLFDAIEQYRGKYATLMYHVYIILEDDTKDSGEEH